MMSSSCSYQGIDPLLLPDIESDVWTHNPFCKKKKHVSAAMLCNFGNKSALSPHSSSENGKKFCICLLEYGTIADSLPETVSAIIYDNSLFPSPSPAPFS